MPAYLMNNDWSRATITDLPVPCHEMMAIYQAMESWLKSHDQFVVCFSDSPGMDMLVRVSVRGGSGGVVYVATTNWSTDTDLFSSFAAFKISVLKLSPPQTAPSDEKQTAAPAKTTIRSVPPPQPRRRICRKNRR